MNIVLIGYRGTGKSAVGALLSRYLGRPLIETDLEIAKAAGKSIRAIFQDDGASRSRPPPPMTGSSFQRVVAPLSIQRMPPVSRPMAS
jgi:hypothetical protein